MFFRGRKGARLTCLGRDPCFPMAPLAGGWDRFRGERSCPDDQGYNSRILVIALID